jgi:hypothetical protein
MRKCTIPALIAFSPALLLPLIQEVIRSHVTHVGLMAFVPSWGSELCDLVLFPVLHPHAA